MELVEHSPMRKMIDRNTRVGRELLEAMGLGELASYCTRASVTSDLEGTYIDLRLVMHSDKEIAIVNRHGR